MRGEHSVIFLCTFCLLFIDLIWCYCIIYSGGSIPLQGLLDFLLTLRGSVVCPDATAFSLLMAMECAPPSSSAPNPLPLPAAAAAALSPPSESTAGPEARAASPSAPAVPVEAAALVSATETGAGVGGGGGGGGGDIPLPEPTLTPPPVTPSYNPSDFDLTCTQMRIDFHDALELLCRVACSPSNQWILVGSSSQQQHLFDGGHTLAHAAANPGNNHGAGEGDDDSVSVYSVSLADLLSERIGLWKQSFDVDSLAKL